MKFNILLLVNLFLFSVGLTAQKGGVRGSILDKETGEPIPSAVVILNDGAQYNAASDFEGFFTIADVIPGVYNLRCQYLGYDSVNVEITVTAGQMFNYNISLTPQIGPSVTITSDREEAQNETRVSVVRVTPKDINRLPSAGGEADIAQYLQVIPGVIFSGDQGGQLYIRGGAPIQNKILLDGVTIYNAFHSIGFFSVFETEIIRSADVYTGGFSAKYGGRSSAIVDIRTREGNKKRFSGMVSINPFVSKVLFEGPIIKLKEESGNSLSFMLTGKHSYLSQTSNWFYKPILERPRTEAANTTLPYTFTDIHGKISYNSANGSRLNAFGFFFKDDANFTNVAEYGWMSGGGGLDFRIVPGTAKMLMDGNVGYSTYGANFVEGDSTKERFSGINSFNGNMNFTYFMAKSRELNYGLEISSLFTDFSFVNDRGIPYGQQQSNTEVAMYGRYKGRFGPVVIEPSVRIQYYASLGEARIEPRIAFKYNITDFLRFKFAGGLYSQNLVSSVDERDIVNLFVGFLGGPDEAVNRITGFDSIANRPVYVPTKSKLQTSIHAIGGFEINIGKDIVLNVEPYIKWFPQIISLNRNRTASNDIYQPVYIAETGKAYGLDFSGKYEKNQLYLYAAYSLGYIKRNDGLQEYYASFDRRHNLNFVGSYKFRIGKMSSKVEEKNRRYMTEHPFEVALRWNLGSGFPFTKTQGFYTLATFQDGINTNYIEDNNNPNTELGIIYADQINTGRLPYYHRLDFSLRYTIDFSKYTKLLLNISVTNVYDRPNIFYFDRVRYRRVNQLPILPAFGVILKF